MSALCAVRRRAADERGYVLVAALVLMVIVLAAALAVLAGTLSQQQLTTRDTQVRSAQQAAEAGLQATLYEQSETNLGANYNDNGGVLGLSNFLDCDVPQLNASGQITGTASLNAGIGGVCPQAETSSGSATTLWQPVGNHTYYEAESAPNEDQFLHGSSSASSEDLEFPELVAIGCTAATITDCENDDSAPTAQYWREELILQPVSPLQAIEGMGSVTINGLSALGLGATTLDGDVQTLGKLTTPTVLLGVNTALASSGLSPTLTASSFGGTIISNAQEVSATPCEPGVPSTNCIIEREPVTLTSSTCTPCSSLPTSDYNASAHTFAMSSGTVNLTAGQYVFCNFDATGGTLNIQTGPVQIFVASPTSALCSGNGYTKTSGVWNGGNFIATQGINNALTGTVNGVSNTIDPSELQIYVLGDSGGYDNATTVSIGDTYTCTAKNVLNVCISATAPAQAMVVYAPTSSVTVNTGTCVVTVLGSCTLGVAGAIDGAIVGDNVSITASSITQDLDIGNYPLYTGVSAFKPVEYAQCDDSVTKLTGTASDVDGC
ncbi:MAG TPA: hypothetical protein VMD48_01270 [Solirubrobacteraceae bacterium]|nr:hypothetical protein [Solirubrobacteraceae bacterium]